MPHTLVEERIARTASSLHHYFSKWSSMLYFVLQFYYQMKYLQKQESYKLLVCLLAPVATHLVFHSFP